MGPPYRRVMHYAFNSEPFKVERSVHAYWMTEKESKMDTEIVVKALIGSQTWLVRACLMSIWGLICINAEIFGWKWSELPEGCMEWTWQNPEIPITPQTRTMITKSASRMLINKEYLYNYLYSLFSLLKMLMNEWQTEKMFITLDWFFNTILF